MRYCRECGKEMREAWRFCLSCGAEAPRDEAEAQPEGAAGGGGTRGVCPGCGGPVRRVDRFCANCGRDLREASAAAREGQIPAPPVLRPPEPEAPKPAARREPGVGRAEIEAAHRSKTAVVLTLFGVAMLGAGLASVLLRRGPTTGGEGVSSVPPGAAASPPVVAVPPAGAAATLEARAAGATPWAGYLEDELQRQRRAAEQAVGGIEAGGARETPTRPDPRLVRARIEEVVEALRACAAGRRTVVSAKVTFEGTTGGVTEATAEGDLPDEARTCAVEALRGLSVPPFTEPTFTVDFSIPVGDP